MLLELVLPPDENPNEEKSFLTSPPPQFGHIRGSSIEDWTSLSKAISQFIHLNSYRGTLNLQKEPKITGRI